MKVAHHKAAHTYVLDAAIIRLLSRGNDRDAIQKRAANQYAVLRAALTPDELAPIDHVAQIMEAVAQKLLGCQNVDALDLSLSYVQALIQGEVMIAEDGPISEAYQPNV